MMVAKGAAFVVDDDGETRTELKRVFDSQELRTFGFATASEYIAFLRPDTSACLIINIRLPDADGLALQKQFANAAHPPIVFIANQVEVASTVRAIKAGAVDFLVKPLNPEAVVGAAYEAIARDHGARQKQGERDELWRRLHRLTPRERDVLPLIISGFLNKQAAWALGISEITYQIHRSRVMHKMQAASLPDLVRMSERLQIPVVPLGGERVVLRGAAGPDDFRLLRPGADERRGCLGVPQGSSARDGCVTG